MHFLCQKRDWVANGDPRGATPEIKSLIWTSFGGHSANWFVFMRQKRAFLKRILFCFEFLSRTECSPGCMESNHTSHFLHFFVTVFLSGVSFLVVQLTWDQSIWKLEFVYTLFFVRLRVFFWYYLNFGILACANKIPIATNKIKKTIKFSINLNSMKYILQHLNHDFITLWQRKKCSWLHFDLIWPNLA